ncbi:MAG: sodium:proline symporter, partial [Verrucomicrobium sp.]
MNFTWDILVLVLYFAVILGIGLAQSRKNKSVESYALGDREMAWWAVLASIIAAEISAATFLGAPETGFSKQNWSYAQFAIGTVLARIIVSFLFIPVFYKHNVVSLYEFLGTRFGPVTRKFASITFMVTRVLAMGTRLYVSAIIIVLAYALWTGAPVQPEMKFWLYAGAVVLVTLMTAIYTSVGGIRAVIWTDFIQVAVLLAALAFTIPYLMGRIPGGWETVSQVIKEPAFFDFAKPAEPGAWAWIKNVLTTEYTIWAAIIGSTFVTMATHGIDQDTVQRMLTAKNRRQSAFATILSGIVDLPLVSAFIFIGVLLYAYYKANPDSGMPVESREVFPYFIMKEMPA